MAPAAAAAATAKINRFSDNRTAAEQASKRVVSGIRAGIIALWPGSYL